MTQVNNIFNGFYFPMNGPIEKQILYLSNLKNKEVDRLIQKEALKSLFFQPKDDNILLLIRCEPSNILESARQFVQTKCERDKAGLLKKLPQFTIPKDVLETAHPLCRVALDMTMAPNFHWSIAKQPPIDPDTLLMEPAPASSKYRFVLCQEGTASFSDLLDEMERKDPIFINCADYVYLVALKAGLVTENALCQLRAHASLKTRSFLKRELKASDTVISKQMMHELFLIQVTARYPFLETAKSVSPEHFSDIPAGQIVILRDSHLHKAMYTHMGLSLGNGYVISHWNIPIDRETGEFNRGAKVLPLSEIIRLISIYNEIEPSGIEITAASPQIIEDNAF